MSSGIKTFSLSLREMELRHVRYFVAVAEELHFGRAARRLHISQPPLSQQIRNLERELGVELFRRTRREVRLTPAGDAFLASARQLVREVELSVDAARRAARGQPGVFTMGYSPLAEIRILPRLVRKLRARFPEVEVRLQSLSPADQIDALRRDAIDAGLLTLPVAAGRALLRPLLEESVLVALPAAHPLARQRRITPCDLREVPLVLFARAQAPVLHDTLRSYARAESAAPRAVHEAATLMGALTVVASGAGASLVSESARDFRIKGVTYRPLEKPGSAVKFAAATSPDGNNPLRKAFLEVIHALYPR